MDQISCESYGLKCEVREGGPGSVWLGLVIVIEPISSPLRYSGRCGDSKLFALLFLPSVTKLDAGGSRRVCDGNRSW